MVDQSSKGHLGDIESRGQVGLGISMKKTVLLVGGGHAHLEIVKALSAEEIAHHRFILISLSRQTFYSGLIPRLIAGEIEEQELTIQSAGFAEAKGIQFIEGEVKSVDRVASTVTLLTGETVGFDVLSINVGGTPRRIPSESPQNTIYLRPFDEFMPKWRELLRVIATKVNPRFVVVGGGAAAVEVAAALGIRFKGSRVDIVTQGSRLCESYFPSISQRIERSLVLRGAKVHCNEPIESIQQGVLRLKKGDDLEFDAIFVVTPTGPSKVVSAKVDSKLRWSENIFAAGDGVQMADQPSLPRSGVVAVHQGRHLVQSLRRVLSNQVALDFQPKKRQLNILVTGESSARLVWGRLSFEGKWPFRIKNWIDERYMAGFD
jgi:selenide,water dikinase